MQISWFSCLGTGKPSQQSSTSWQLWQIFWSAGKPSQLYSQHLGSQCSYLNSVVWEAKPTMFNHLGSHGRFFGQLGSLASYSQHLGSQFRYLDSVVWEAKPALCIINILAASYKKYLQHLGIRCKYIQPLGSQEPSRQHPSSQASSTPRPEIEYGTRLQPANLKPKMCWVNEHIYKVLCSGKVLINFINNSPTFSAVNVGEILIFATPWTLFFIFSNADALPKIFLIRTVN